MSGRLIDLSRVRAPKRRRNPVLRELSRLLHTLGFTSMLFLAVAFNFALHPDALAQVTGAELVSFSTTPNQTPTVDPEDVHLLAATAWAEARSEGEAGMRAVAHVIVNRLGGRFGQDLRSVIFAPRQFSAWNAHDPNRRLAQDPERYAADGANRDTWEIAQQVALQVLDGQSVDPTNGALFYHARSVRPRWSAQGVGRLEIGSHVFYHDVLCTCRTRWRPDDPTMAAATPDSATVTPVSAQPATPTPLPPDSFAQISGSTVLTASQ
jgi:N-acetylmuramoyl-L-alanine amidase